MKRKRRGLDKTAVLAALREQVEADLRAAVESQRATHEAATHEESRPENDKDTRALEASYLARGLAQRVVDLTATKAAFTALSHAVLDDDTPVAAGALVVLEDEDARESVYFVAPSGGGLRVQIAGTDVRVVTPQAPLGEALLGKRRGDDVELRTPLGLREMVIVDVT